MPKLGPNLIKFEGSGESWVPSKEDPFPLKHDNWEEEDSSNREDFKKTHNNGKNHKTLLLCLVKKQH